jgi:dTDP-4-amino-4,6-dideoxygalactose transaminase
MKVPIARPYFGLEEVAAIQRPIESGWVVQGPWVKSFEEKFSAFTGSPYCAATSSCTTALHLAVAALGLKPGDEVIVPAFTWVATPNVVEYMGGRPVFCDIELGSYNIDTKKIESLITPRTVGLIPVHLFGLSATMDELMAIAKNRRLWVVEDAACSFGGRYHGRHTGTFGEFGCFSFHPRKSITTGEGGMLTTSRKELDQLIRSLRDHGSSRSDLERHESSTGFLLGQFDHLGYNYRMTDIQGALGCVQMDRCEWILREKARRAAVYDRELSVLPWLGLPTTPPGVVHGYQAYVTLFRPEAPSVANVEHLNQKRNRLMSLLDERGVATRQGTHAPVLQGYYRRKYGLKPQEFPNALVADKTTLALPLFPHLTEADQGFVVDSLKACYNEI